MTSQLDVLTIGRVGVDLYPLQDNVALKDVQSFSKSLGGSPTNVAIAAARHGHRTAVITRTGPDSFGEFVHEELGRFGVSDEFVVPVDGLLTPLAFCENYPPDHFPLQFYRLPTAPDLVIRPEELDPAAIAGAGIYWSTVTGLSAEPSRAAHFAAWRARNRRSHTILDLDYRPVFWADPATASEQVRAALPHVTIAIGNKEECEIAVGETEPRRAAQALLDAGVQIAIVKQGPKGVLGMTADEVVEVPAHTGGSDQRARRRGQLRRRVLPRPALRLGPGEDPAVRQRGRRPGRHPPRVLHRDAHHRRGLDPAERGLGMTSMLSRYERLTQTRAVDPGAIRRAADARVKAPLVPADGRLMIIACDHPARGANGVGDRPLAMADRGDLLDRLQTALSRPGVDGLLGSPDIIEDLLLLGALDGKVVFGSMNRGGLQGAAFELDDRFTGYDARGIAEMGLNGGKTLTRVALDDPGTAGTLTATARAVDELAERGLAAMVEPFWSSRVDGKVRNDLSADAVIKSVGVASALGRTSAHTWLKLPVVPEMERVMASTTFPTLLLGGDPDSDPEQTYASWRAALTLPAVRGLVVGRTLLYPADDDVAAAVDTAAAMVR